MVNNTRLKPRRKIILFGIYVYFPKQLHFQTNISVHEVNIVKSHHARENAGRVWVEGSGGKWGVREEGMQESRGET